jgi:type IV pilus assembly protein PilN
MRFEINLASQPFQDVRRFLLRWGVAALAVGVVTVALVYMASAAFFSWRVTKGEVNNLQQQIAERDQQKAEIQAFLNRPENRDTRDRAQFLNFLFARKAFSWTEVFTDLEKIMPPRLRVVAIRPTVNNENQLELHLSVAGGARDAVVELAHRLEQSPHFSHAVILTESVQQTESGPKQQNRTDSYRFELSANYIPSFARPAEQAVREDAAAVQSKGASAVPVAKPPVSPRAASAVPAGKPAVSPQPPNIPPAEKLAFPPRPGNHGGIGNPAHGGPRPGRPPRTAAEAGIGQH